MTNEMNEMKKNSRSPTLTLGRLLTGLPGKEKGTVSIMIALFLVVLIGFAGLVVDLGHLFAISSSLHTAADSASLVATASLGYGPDEARAQAQLLAQKHGIHGSPVALLLSDIELGTWDKKTKTFTLLLPDQEANSNSVRVTAQRSAARNNPVSLFFMRIFGHELSDVKVVSVAYSPSGECGAIIGEKAVSLNSSATTGSYSGVFSPANTNDNGSVCSCGDITLTSSAIVNGDAIPGYDHEVFLNSSAYVTGSMDSGECPVLADVDFGDVATNNDNDKIGLTDEGNDPFEDGPYAFALNSNDSLTLPGGTYYFSSFSINSSSQLRFTGPTVIYVTGSFQIDSTGIVNESQIPENLIILISSNEEVKIKSSVDFHGVIYAPNAHVVNDSSVDFFGAIFGDEVTINSTVEIHYDEALEYNNFLNSMVSFGGSFASSVLVQ